jgi:predicted HAD superfamily Cof-like phosphohydrolase
MLVAAIIDQLEVVQQADLQAQQIKAGVEVFEALQLGGGVARGDQAFQQVVEALHQAIAEAKAVIAGQAVEQGHEPLDQIHGGLDNRQFAATGGTH